MALDNFELGIRSVTYTRNSEGELVEQDAVDWAINDYHVNNQAEELEPTMETFAGSAPKKRKRKGVAHETPAAIGDEMITKATEKDLRKRGLK